MSNSEAVAEAVAKAALATAPALDDSGDQRTQAILSKMNADLGMFLLQYVDAEGSDTKHLFELIVLEFLKVMVQYDNSYAPIHKTVFDLICSATKGIKGRLRGVLTITLWDRLDTFVSQFEEYLKDRTLPMPGIFTGEDVPATAGLDLDDEEDDDEEYLIYHHSAGKALSTTQISFKDIRELGMSQTISKSIAEAKPAENLPKANWHTFHIAKMPDTLEMMTPAKRLNLPVPDDKPKKKRKRLPLRGSAEDRVYIEGNPTDDDVMYGRGGGTNNHKGNIRYLLEKLKLQPAYILLASQKGKKAISQQLVQTVKDWGGRFVDRDEDGKWYIVDDSIARKKASQTLREDKTPEEQASKRNTLERKLQEIEGSGRKKSNSVQERHAGEALLGLSGGGFPGEEENEAAVEKPTAV